VAAVCHVCDLGGVEELGAHKRRDYLGGHGVRDTCDKIADIFGPGKRRHGIAVCMISFAGGIALAFAFCAFCLIGARPSVQAAGDGGVCGGGDGFVRLARSGDGLDGFCHTGFLGVWVPDAFLYSARNEGNYLQGLAVQADAFGQLRQDQLSSADGTEIYAYIWMLFWTCLCVVMRKFQEEYA
jgi:hypothetical protein